GLAWERLAEWHRKMGDRLVEAILTPLPGLQKAFGLGPVNLFKFASASVRSAAGLSCKLFRTEPARRGVPGLSLHVDLGPGDFAGAGLGLVLALLASSNGFPVPVGGARAIAQAIIRRLEEAGGRLRLNAHVDHILVRKKRAVAVRTSDGD